MMSAASNGETLAWNSKSLEFVETHYENNMAQNLVSILTSQNYLIKHYEQKIEIFEADFTCKKALELEITSASELDENQTISCVCVANVSDDEEMLWAGNSVNGIICIWSLLDFELKIRVAVDCLGLSVFQKIDDMVWVGSNDGKISLFCADTFEYEKTFQAHKDCITALCGSKNKSFVVSGSDSKDGTIGVWNSSKGQKRSIVATLNRLLADEF